MVCLNTKNTDIFNTVTQPTCVRCRVIHHCKTLKYDIQREVLSHWMEQLGTFCKHGSILKEVQLTRIPWETCTGLEKTSTNKTQWIFPTAHVEGETIKNWGTNKTSQKANISCKGNSKTSPVTQDLLVDLVWQSSRSLHNSLVQVARAKQI